MCIIRYQCVSCFAEGVSCLSLPFSMAFEGHRERLEASCGVLIAAQRWIWAMAAAEPQTPVQRTQRRLVRGSFFPEVVCTVI
jgi:hypothetical protein